MQLRLGTYSFPANALRIGSDLRALLNMAKERVGFTAILDVEGFLSGDTQEELSDLTRDLEAACLQQNVDLVFYQDDGSASATGLVSANSLSGVQIVSGPRFQAVDGDYATLRKFSFQAAAEYADNGTSNKLMSFTEQLIFSGGGRKYVIREARRGPPQRQLVTPQSAYRAIQRGRLVGYRQKFDPPLPKWPRALLDTKPVVQDTTPSKIGPRSYKDFETTWEYQFASATPLVGTPTLWT